MSHNSRSAQPVAADNPLFDSWSLLGHAVATVLSEDRGRESVRRFLLACHRDVRLRDWETGRVEEPPRDLGYGTELNAALKDYLVRTHTWTTDQGNPAPQAAATRCVPCLIVVATRRPDAAPSISLDPSAFTGCCGVFPSGITSRVFRIDASLEDTPAGVRVLALLLRGDTLRRIRSLLDLPSDHPFPPIEEGLDSLEEGDGKVDDSRDAAEIARHMARDAWLLSDAPDRSSPRAAGGSAENRFRRGFWLATLLAATPALAGVTTSRDGRTVFCVEVELGAELELPRDDLYCVLMLDC